MKDYYKYITGYDQYINAYDKYTKDFLEKIFTAMTIIFTAMPKKYLRLLCPMYQWSVARQNGGGGVDDLESIFLHSLPSLFRQAERNLHCDNSNF